MIKFTIVINILLLVFLTLSEAQRDRTLYENDMCKPGDSRWVCKRLSKCTTAQQAIRAGEWPDTCTFDGLEPIVCCPPAKTNTPTSPSKPTVPTRPTRPNKNSKAAKMCEKYAEYVFRFEESPLLTAASELERFDECAITSETLIVGGVDAAPKEFPHMVQIGYGDKPRIAWLCGGSLISDRFVLSAAHCTKPNNRGPAKWARIGDLNTSTDKDDANPIILRIVERIDHPGYDSVRLYNDIALYKLERTITLDYYIRPICLDLGGTDDRRAIATGWGHLMWGGRGSDMLQKVTLNLVSQNRCNQSYASNIGSQLPDGIVDSYMLCAGDEKGKDSCQGDSGGPLQVPVKDPYCMYRQIGITSFGKECGSTTPGVYTRVATYVPWIEKIVWP